MRNSNKSALDHYRDFLFETNAALPWHVPSRRAATYAGLIWIIILTGVIVVKLSSDGTERPLTAKIAQSAALPLLLFIVFIHCHSKADEARRIKDENLKERD